MQSEIAQTDRRFRGAAYRYLRISDKLPTYQEIDPDDPICRVKLFLPGSRLTFYVFAVTRYGTADVITSYCVSALGPDCDEEGDQPVTELLRIRNTHGLPLERDLGWEPMRLSQVRELEVPA